MHSVTQYLEEACIARAQLNIYYQCMFLIQRIVGDAALTSPNNSHTLRLHSRTSSQIVIVCTSCQIGHHCLVVHILVHM